MVFQMVLMWTSILAILAQSIRLIVVKNNPPGIPPLSPTFSDLRDAFSLRYVRAVKPRSI